MIMHFCSQCGNALSDNPAQPQTCEQCRAVFYQNPIPVAVMMTPVVGEQEEFLGFIMVQRKQEPQAQRWALPGGFVGQNESVEQAAVRELLEETGISITKQEKRLDLMHTRITPNGKELLIFVRGPLMQYKHIQQHLTEFSNHSEIQAVAVMHPDDITVAHAFPLHKEAMQELGQYYVLTKKINLGRAHLKIFK